MVPTHGLVRYSGSMSSALAGVLAAFPIGTASSVEPFGNGRLHVTYLADTDSGRYVVQRMSTAISSNTLKNTKIVTEHLRKKGIATSLLVETHDGQLSYTDQSGALWRLMTYIPGTTIERRPSSSQAASAAAFLARFHEALADLDTPLAPVMEHFHDTPYAIAELQLMITTHAGEFGYDMWRRAADRILALADAHLTSLDASRKQVCHGDPKINNFRFDLAGKGAVALIDLDTVGTYPLAIDVGDLLRSVCARLVEPGRMTLDTAVWDTTLNAYETEGVSSDTDEIALIPAGFVAVTIELAARYAVDAYRNNVFTLNSRFSTLFEQGIARAHELSSLIDSFIEQRSADTASTI